MKKRILLILTLVFISIGLIACKNDKPIEEPNHYEELLEAHPNNDIYYQIFVRSFADSNDDGIGDLNGITNKLDYLSNLGVTALWLTPIHPSDSYHGYEVKDYYAINPDFGTMDDFDNLIKEAKKKDIKIIMDTVFNHSSDQTTWYQEALNDVNSKYREFYLWRSNTPGQEAYETFPYSRDLNLKSEALKKELLKVLEFYLEKGVAGFRFDAVKHFFIKPFDSNYSSNPNYEGGMLLRYFKQNLRQKYPDVYFVGEYFDYSINPYQDIYLGSNSMFNFEISKMFQDGNYASLQSSINRIYSTLDGFNPNAIDAPFITNHDLNRFGSMQQDPEKQKLAARILLTLPGNPFIYYGEELGMKGERIEGGTLPGYVDKDGEPIVIYDEPRRQSFVWGGDDEAMTTWFPLMQGNEHLPGASVQQTKEDSLFNTYKEMIKIRKETPALRFGKNITRVDSIPGTVAFIKEIKTENYSQIVLVVHNVVNQTREVNYQVIKDIYGSKTLAPGQTYIAEIKSTTLQPE